MVLVSIVGDYDSSIIPVFYELKNKITKHIIIHDDSKYDAKTVNRIIKGQKNISKHLGLDYELITIKIDEDSYEEILSCYGKIMFHANNKGSKVYLNGTDGLSSVCIVLSEKILSNGGTFISYDRFDNQCNVITQKGMKKNILNNNNTITSHLIQKGYTITNHGKKEEALERKDIIMELCDDLKKLQEFSRQLHSESFDEIPGFKRIKKLLKSINKEHDQAFIQGTIFEEYIFWLIHDNFNFDDVMFNVSVEITADLYNEFDILMIKDNHLHTIECKLRRYVDGEGLVYKIDSTMSFLDNDDARGMIVLIGGDNDYKPTYYGNKKKIFSEGTSSRANESMIKIHHDTVFNKQKFLEDVKEHFIKPYLHK